MIIPYVILVLGYAFIISLFLMITIWVKGKWIMKFCMVPILLWFGLFLYNVPPQLTGYPSEQEIQEDQVVVRYFTQQSPTATDKGCIYVLVDTRFFKDAKKNLTFLDKINPKTYTSISQYEYLRLYRIPWNEEAANDMNNARKKNQLIILQKNKLKSGNEDGKGSGKGKNGNAKMGNDGNPDESEIGDADGEGDGTGGTSKHSGNKDYEYNVKALSPNEMFRKN
jgi:hypothetical protein